VPVSLLNNYHILPDASPFRVRWAPSRIIIHEPIPTTGLTQADADALRERTYRIIEQALVRAAFRKSDGAGQPVTTNDQ
jgi:1-acyl-sn-glycerol-3-phosphate acyltransferase